MEFKHKATILIPPTPQKIAAILSNHMYEYEPIFLLFEKVITLYTDTCAVFPTLNPMEYILSFTFSIDQYKTQHYVGGIHTHTPLFNYSLSELSFTFFFGMSLN
ncbi:unnamed protein product [Cuscuta epithymum]|uniref:Uncharacterized protein n=1 Tax=Cuscuta epithymum TaxID=186058 RepID=A0AAV0EMZ1_9ASTE|nr:unnamed protein product [Cuscuta epithymum]